MQFKTAYGKRNRVQFNTDPASLTHLSSAPECDINRIMLKWEKTGILEHRNNFEGQYGDFTDVPQDYHESMNAVIAAQEMFLTLPAKLRRRFANDPGNFLDFISNEENVPEMVKMGLATARPDVIDDLDQPTPQKKKAASPPPPPPPNGDE